VEEDTKDLIMQVKGMTCQGCVNAVTKAVQRLDPGAKVHVDLDHERVSITTRAQSIEVAEAINRAGYEAMAMTL